MKTTRIHFFFKFSDLFKNNNEKKKIYAPKQMHTYSTLNNKRFKDCKYH